MSSSRNARIALALAMCAVGALFALLLTRDRTASGPADPEPVSAPSTPVAPRLASHAATPTALPQVPDRDSVVVRDLANGAPVPGVRFLVTTGVGAAAQERVSDAAGALERGKADQLSLPETELVWTLVDAAPGRDSIWLARSLTIRGVVRLSDDRVRRPDLSSVVLDLRAVAPPRTGIAPSPDPWNLEWALQHHLGFMSQHAVDAQGSFALKARRTKYLGVRASAPGWRSEFVEVRVDPAGDRDPPTIDVLLHPIPNVEGVILDADGKPLAHVRAKLQVLLRMRAEDVDGGRSLIDGFAMGVVVGPDLIAKLTYQAEAVTNAEGKFSIASPVLGDDLGDALVTVHAVGFAPKRVTLADAGGFGVQRLDPGLASSVQFLYKGEPLAPGGFTFLDVTDPDHQTSIPAKIGENGMVSTTWLEVGRSYGILLPGGRGGLLRWAGTSPLDVADLPTSPTKFQRDTR